MAVSDTECLSFGVVIVTVPVRLPWPIAYEGTSYSASWSMSGLVRMKSKKWFRRVRSAAGAACCHAAPQKIVNTSTAAMSGPFRYVSRGAAAGAAAAASGVGVWTSPGRLRGTMRIGSP